MKRIILLPIVALCMPAFAQKSATANYAQHITGQRLKEHLTIIASDEMQGRETGTEGQRKAAAYIQKQFQAIGLKTPPGQTGYQQYYPLFQDSLRKSELKIGKAEPVYGTDYIVSLPANETGKFKSDNLVFAGYGIEDSAYSDYTGLDVKGKVVIILAGEPKKDGLYLVSGAKNSSAWTFPGTAKKIGVAAAKGAVGAIVISPMQETFSQRMIDNSMKTAVQFPRESKDAKLNYVMMSPSFAKTISPEMAEWIDMAKNYAAFTPEQHKLINQEVKYEFTKMRMDLQSSNVIGVLEGTDLKDEYVFVTGHYDHLGMRNGKIYYGADDDGSGTVSVITMAEAFAKAKKAGKGPRRTMVFMTVSGEEKGLWGSEYYSDHPLFPLDKTSVDLNIDMVGRVDTERKKDDTLNYVYVVGHDKLSSELPGINEAANKASSNITLDYLFDDPNDKNRIYFRSDHYNFARKGVPVLFFYDGMLKADYHQPTDTVDKINFPLYEKRVRMIFTTAWEMANRNKMLVRDIPLPAMSR